MFVATGRELHCAQVFAKEEPPTAESMRTRYLLFCRFFVCVVDSNLSPPAVSQSSPGDGNAFSLYQHQTHAHANTQRIHKYASSILHTSSSSSRSIIYAQTQTHHITLTLTRSFGRSPACATTPHFCGYASNVNGIVRACERAHRQASRRLTDG